MHSPLYSQTRMQRMEIEPGLDAYECPVSGGHWIPLPAYLAWKEHHPEAAKASLDPAAPMPHDDSHQRALICPESGRLLLRYRVGHGLNFHLDRSPATGGVWLDRGEWEGLKSKGLHFALHLIFTATYQREIRTEEYLETLTATFRDRIGQADFPKVADFAAWLAHHPKRRDICCFLTDTLEHSVDPTAVDSSAVP